MNFLDGFCERICKVFLHGRVYMTLPVSDLEVDGISAWWRTTIQGATEFYLDIELGFEIGAFNDETYHAFIEKAKNDDSDIPWFTEQWG